MFASQGPPKPWEPPADITPYRPPPPAPSQESAMDYWSRSPLVGAVEGAAGHAAGALANELSTDVGRGAELVGQGARAVAGAPYEAGQWIGRSPIVQRVAQPYIDEARAAAGYVNRGVEAIEGGAGQAAGLVNRDVVQPAAAWWRQNVVPPPLPPPVPVEGPPWLAPITNSPTPPLPSAPAPATNYRTATNPRTGQKLIFKDGRWQPM